MSKRFTDTDKWNKMFIRGLKPTYKLLWLYILDHCDTAGIWDVDIEVAQIKIGAKINEQDALQSFNQRVISITQDKWFVVDFCSFQYGQLSEDNRAHTKAIAQLQKYNLTNYKPLISPLQGATQAPKDKEEDKVLGKKEVNENFENFKAWLKENAPFVAKMKVQITLKEYLLIKENVSTENLTRIIKNMDNWGKLGNRKYVFRTFNTFLNNEIEQLKNKSNKPIM